MNRSLMFYPSYLLCVTVIDLTRHLCGSLWDLARPYGVCTRIDTHAHAWKLWKRTSTHTTTRTTTHTCAHTRTHAHAITRKYTYTCTHIHAHKHTHTHTNAHTSTHIHTHTQRERERANINHLVAILVTNNHVLAAARNITLTTKCRLNYLVIFDYNTTIPTLITRFHYNPERYPVLFRIESWLCHKDEESGRDRLKSIMYHVVQGTWLVTSRDTRLDDVLFNWHPDPRYGLMSPDVVI